MNTSMEKKISRAVDIESIEGILSRSVREDLGLDHSAKSDRLVREATLFAIAQYAVGYYEGYTEKKFVMVTQ